MTDSRILVVEDEHVVALDIQSVLLSLGYQVVGLCTTGRDAIRKAEQTQPDLVLMDIQLQGDMDGIEAAKRIRATLDIPVIYLTALSTDEIVARARTTDAFGYLLKPFHARELHTTVEMALYKHQAERKLKTYAAQLERTNCELGLINRLMEGSLAGWDEDELIGQACVGLARALGIPRALAVFLDRASPGQLTVAEYDACDGLADFQHRAAVQDTPLVRLLISATTPQAIDDVRRDPRAESIRDGLHWRHASSLLLVPIVVEGEAMGGIVLEAPDVGAFDDGDVQLAGRIAHQIGSMLGQLRLSEERQRLTAAIEQAAEHVIITDAEGRIVYVNPAFEKTTGYAAHQMLGEPAQILGSECENADAYEELQAALADGRTWRGRLVNKARDGSRYTVAASVTPVRNGQGTIVNCVSVQRDVTHELAMEEHYRRARQIEAVGRLAAAIAHDFNNLLTVINGFATLIKMRLGPQDKVSTFADKILASGERASELVGKLLALSRRQVLAPQLVRLSDLVSAIRGDLARLLPEHARLETQLADALWPVRVDAEQIQQAITHLVSNATDAMPEGGTVTITTANVALDQMDPSFDPEAQAGEYVCLAVQDTGVGMSDEVKAHLFEPFFTTKDIGKGMGLGLATVYGLVKQSGGHLRVVSAVGKGTTVEVYLPRIVQEAVRDEPASPTTPHRADETILLVDDDEAVRELAGEVLQSAGYTLLQASDGFEACRLASKHAGTIDLLLTDVRMPGMDGKTLADRLVKARPDLQVLYMSGYADGLLENESPFLAKPFQPIELARKVRAVLNGRHSKGVGLSDSATNDLSGLSESA